MKDKADALAVPDFLEHWVLQPSLVQLAVLPLGEVAVGVTAWGRGLHLPTQETALAVKPGVGGEWVKPRVGGEREEGLSFLFSTFPEQ